MQLITNDKKIKTQLDLHSIPEDEGRNLPLGIERYNIQLI